MDASQFYTGIVADLYEPLKSTTHDPALYREFIAESGEPALELGCGDGDPLLALRGDDLDVEGVDSSADILRRCHRKADDLGIDVTLHHQRMEALSLPKRYRSIFLAGPTVTLLPDDETVVRALRCIHAHLKPDGRVHVPLFIPSPTPREQIGKVREARADDGAVLRFTILDEHRDDARRNQSANLRYERHAGGEAEVVDREWTLHWHTVDTYQSLVAQAGLTTVNVLDTSGGTAAPDAFEFAFRLRR